MDEQFSNAPLDETNTPDEVDATDSPLDVNAEVVDTVDEPENEDEDACDPDPLAGAFQYYAPERPKKRNWPIVLLAVLLVIVFAGGLLWAFGVFGTKDTKEPDETTSDTDGTAFGTKDVSDLMAAESANLQITNGMFSFYMESMYIGFQSQYSYYLPSMGLDTSVSTKEQTCPVYDGSWFDYFKTYAKNDVEWMLVMGEAAKEAGMTLDSAAQEQVDNIIASTDFSMFHNGVTVEDGTALLTLYYTALAQETAVYNAITYTSEEVETYYNANSANFDVCSYAYFPFSIGEDGDFATAEDAQNAVAALTACRTADEFRSAVAAYLVSTGAYETEEEAAAAYDSACVQTGVSYSADDGISDWLFDSETAVGDTKTVENTGSIAVYMLTADRSRDASKTVNVRHILLTADTYGSDDAASAKAEELLAAWKAGEATADSFGELAAQYTEDSNGSSGGLYEGVTEGYMVETFNDWCFDESRQPGDSGIVQTSYGYHVMYFEGAQEAWYGNVLDVMRDAAYEELYATCQSQYTVTFHDDNIDQNDM